MPVRLRDCGGRHGKISLSLTVLNFDRNARVMELADLARSHAIQFDRASLARGDPRRAKLGETYIAPTVRGRCRLGTYRKSGARALAALRSSQQAPRFGSFQDCDSGRSAGFPVHWGNGWRNELLGGLPPRGRGSFVQLSRTYPLRQNGASPSAKADARAAPSQSASGPVETDHDPPISAATGQPLKSECDDRVELDNAVESRRQVVTPEYVERRGQVDVADVNL